MLNESPGISMNYIILYFYEWIIRVYYHYIMELLDFNG